MSKHINGRSIESALNDFDFRSQEEGFVPYYEIKVAGACISSNKKDDIDIAREKLERYLSNQKNEDSAAIVSIVYHSSIDKSGKFAGSQEVFNVRLNPVNDYSVSGQPAVQNNVIAALESKIDSLAGQIAAMQEEPEEEEDDEEDEGFLSGITKSPEFKNYLMQMFFQNMGLQSNQGYQSAPTINGVDELADERDKIKTALSIISKHTKSLGDDLMKLAEMSESNPQQFQFLLSMLRK